MSGEGHAVCTDTVHRWSKTKTKLFLFGFGSTRDVNTAIMELLVMAYALKTSCAKNIIGVIPYFPYSKQCKMRKRGSIVCKLLASMLAKAGKNYTVVLCVHGFNLMCTQMNESHEWQLNVCGDCDERPWHSSVFNSTGLTHIITMDLHQKEIQGFFSFPVDNLRASPFLIQYIQEEVIWCLLVVFKYSIGVLSVILL